MQCILIVADEPSVGAATKILLEHEGVEVRAVESGEAGLKAFETTPFDAVIVDIFMPGMDGFATIKAFRKLRPSVPIIAISGFMDLYAFRDTPDKGPDILSMAAVLGAAKSVYKPFRPHDLLSAVQDSLSVAA